MRIASHFCALSCAVRAFDAGAGIRLEQIIVDLAPLLRPHVAEQLRRDRLAGGHLVRAVFLGELRARMAVQLLIKGLDLLPQSLRFLVELLRRHVVPRPPHHAEILEAELARPFVRQRDELRIRLAHRPRRFVPALPCLEELSVVAARGEHFGQLIEVPAGIRRFAARAIFGFAVHRLESRAQPGQFGAFRSIPGRRRRHADLEELNRARRGGRSFCPA